MAAGSTNVMVPILIIFALELGLKTTTMVQMFNMCFLAGKLAQMAIFAAAGLFGPTLLVQTAPLAAVALLALLLAPKECANKERSKREAHFQGANNQPV